MSRINHHKKENPSVGLLYPFDSFEQKISFDSIRRILKENCLSQLGEEFVDEISFIADYETILQNLSETDELQRLLNSDSDELPVGDMHDIREALARVRIDGLFLDETELFNIYRSLQATVRLTSFILQQEEDQYPFLHRSIEHLASFSAIIRRIDQILDKFGKIKDHASPELARIRKDMNAAQGSVSRALNSILKQAQAEGFVEKDLSPTLRDGRLVIPVSPAFKRKIKGIVHDESATGKTIFIEPQQVVEANNRIRELENEERREIMRILLEITNYLKPFFQDILDSQYFLGKIDFLRTKALFANRIGGIKPQLENEKRILWEKAIHPLLYLNLKKQGKKIVPLDIELNSEQRILLISGPNAGGKSVCLKTVALLQYMLQCGLLIPIQESSKAGVFEKIFIDIGDEQSIENDLSTYSSHLMNIKHFIRFGTSGTLMLIDEFGTGTEPQIGGALAEAALERFNRKEMYGVITTHYTNLKHYAEDAPGVVNGAMLYDRQNLQPLFQLQIGQPGSSFAVEIARKIGLPEDLIEDAAEKVGQKHLDYDKYLQDIVRDKRYWERKRQEIRLKEKRLQETLTKYESELEITDKMRKEITNRAKSDAENLLKSANAKIENTIRLIKEAGAEKERTREARQSLEQFRNKELKKISGAAKEQQERPKLKHKKQKEQTKKTQEREELQFAVGQSVKLVGQSVVGTIIELQNSEALVAFGQLKSNIKLNKLEIVSNRQAKKSSKTRHNPGVTITDNVRETRKHFSSEIDVRGMRWEEALQAVTYFIDDALMLSVANVRILHGTGTGALRQVIREYLGTVHGVRKYHDEHVQFGGAGITVVELE